jgi:hypothetical protein
MWIMRRVKNKEEITEIEIDITQFNRWIATKRGRPYDGHTIRDAVEQLETHCQGMFHIKKHYTPWIKKLIVYPYYLVEMKNSISSGKQPKPNAGKPMFSEQHKLEESQQQHQYITKAEELLKKIGLNFDAHAIRRIYRLSGKCIDRLVKSLEHLLYRNSNGVEKIGNPEGFLINSLTYGWSDNFDLYYEPEIPVFSTRKEIGNFMNSLVKDISPEKIPRPAS